MCALCPLLVFHFLRALDLLDRYLAYYTDLDAADLDIVACEQPDNFCGLWNNYTAAHGEEISTGTLFAPEPRTAAILCMCVNHAVLANKQVAWRRKNVNLGPTDPALRFTSSIAFTWPVRQKAALHAHRLGVHIHTCC